MRILPVTAVPPAMQLALPVLKQPAALASALLLQRQAAPEVLDLEQEMPVQLEALRRTVPVAFRVAAPSPSLQRKMVVMAALVPAVRMAAMVRIRQAITLLQAQPAASLPLLNMPVAAKAAIVTPQQPVMAAAAHWV